MHSGCSGERDSPTRKNAHHKGRCSLSTTHQTNPSSPFAIPSGNSSTPSLLAGLTQQQPTKLQPTKLQPTQQDSRSSRHQSLVPSSSTHSGFLTRYLASSATSSPSPLSPSQHQHHHQPIPGPSHRPDWAVSSTIKISNNHLHNLHYSHTLNYSASSNPRHPALSRLNTVGIDNSSATNNPRLFGTSSSTSHNNPIGSGSTNTASGSGSATATSAGMRSSINLSSNPNLNSGSSNNNNTNTNSNSNTNTNSNSNHWNSNPNLAGGTPGNRSTNLLLDPRSGSANGPKDRNGHTNQNGNNNNSSASQLEAKVVILGMQGASFCTKKLSVDGCKVRLQIWDTAGQERFRSMAPMYYRGANAAILVYDITNRESFLDIQNWLDELRQNMTSDLIIQIVGSKADLGMHQRAVQLDEAYKKIIEWTQPNGRGAQVDTTTGGGFQFNLIHDEDENFLSGLGPPPHHHAHHHHSNPNLDELSSAGTSSSNNTNNPNNNNNLSNSNNNNNNNNNNMSSNPTSSLDFLLGSNSNNNNNNSNNGINSTSSNSPLPNSSAAALTPLGSSFSRWNHVGISEVSAKDDFGIEDLFLILTRRLVLRKVEIDELKALRTRDSILIGGGGPDHHSLNHPDFHLDDPYHRHSNDFRNRSGWCC